MPIHVMWKAVSNVRTTISVVFVCQIISYQSTSKQPSHFVKKSNARLTTVITASKQMFAINVWIIISLLKSELVNKDQEM